MKLPNEQKWSQSNKSDFFGTICASKNINLDASGYVKLSPRTVLLKSEADDSAHGVPVAFGVYQTSNNDATSMLIGTSDSPFTFTPANNSLAYTEDEGTSNPTMTVNSHAVFWEEKWHASTATTVLSRTTGSDTWTSRITGLTSGVRHIIRPFKNRNSICVSNGNVVKQYNTSYSGTVDLTLPAEFEVVGMEYNNYQMGIIANLSANTSSGITEDSYFFVWDGSTTTAGQGLAIGSAGAFTVRTYKGSFVLLSEEGQALYFTGGGFQDLGSLPYYGSTPRMSFDVKHYGDTSASDGDVVYMNCGNELYVPNQSKEQGLWNFPAGIWCLDSEVGLYHRASPSISQVYLVSVGTSDVNTTTNVITGTGTIPATGNVARYTYNDGTNIGGLTLFTDYYIIKLTSSTFKLATTKENALNGIAIDLTSQSTNTNYFYMYDLKDYGQQFYAKSGAVAIMPLLTNINESLIMGANLFHTNLTEYSDACMTVPRLENRGYFVISKLRASGISDKNQKIYINYKPLDTNDAIIVKYKPRDVLGLPLVSPQGTYTNSHATWTSTREFYTSSDLSRAKTYLDASDDNHLEIEFVAGAGSGQAVRIISISAPEAGVYSVVLEEDVIGASAGLKSYFIIDNWKVLKSVTATTQTNDGVLEVPVGDDHKWFFTKVELRGYDTTIELVEPISVQHKKPV